MPIELHCLLFIDYYSEYDEHHILVNDYYYYYYYWFLIYLTRNKSLLIQYDSCELKLSVFKFKSTINENLLHQYIMDNDLKKKH